MFAPKRSPDPHELLPLTSVVLHILLALADGDGGTVSGDTPGKHGYAVAQEVEAITAGQIRMGPGTLYGSIQRMLTAELIEEVPRHTGALRSRPPHPPDAERRRYYRLTLLGRRTLELELARLARLVRVARSKQLLPNPEPA
jgi:DNA-binding PadR family transcriptional regulator